MIYTITEKNLKLDTHYANGKAVEHQLNLMSQLINGNPVCSLVAVDKDVFDSLQVGDSIGIHIKVMKEASNG